MAPLRRLVLDVMKPHDPELVAFTDRLAAVESVDAVTASLVELDQEVQEVVVTLEGESLQFDEVEAAIEELGAVVHSVDEVARGSHVADRGTTPKGG